MSPLQGPWLPHWLWGSMLISWDPAHGAFCIEPSIYLMFECSLKGAYAIGILCIRKHTEIVINPH